MFSKYRSIVGLLMLAIAFLAFLVPVNPAAASEFDYLWTPSAEYYVSALSPLQAPIKQQIQAPILKQELQLQAPIKAELQAPSKLAIREKSLGFCTLIPGRANRLARRAARIEGVSVRQSLKASITSLEPLSPVIGGTGSIVSQEPGVCGGGGSCGGGQCNSGGGGPLRRLIGR